MAGPPACVHVVDVLKDGGAGAAVGAVAAFGLVVPWGCESADNLIGEPVLDKCTAVVGGSYIGAAQWTFLTDERWWSFVLLFVVAGAFLGWLMRLLRS